MHAEVIVVQYTDITTYFEIHQKIRWIDRVGK